MNKLILQLNIIIAMLCALFLISLIYDSYNDICGGEVGSSYFYGDKPLPMCMFYDYKTSFQVDKYADAGYEF